MPGAVAPASPSVGGAAPTAAPQKPFQFNSGAPGSGAQTAGTNYAMQNLNSALGLSGQTTQFQQQQLGQQLQNNEANVGQNLTNRGLGNTTISQTMAQAPLQTYNMGMAQVGDLNAQRQMQAYGNLANAAMQGGNSINATQQPYSQSQYANQLSQMQQLQNAKNASMQGGVAAQNAMGNQPIGQNQQQQQVGQGQASLYYQGPGAPSNLGGGQTDQQTAMAAMYPWLAGNTNYAQTDDSGGD
jgi:hypothetical protein